MDKDTNPSAIISLESDEEMETNAESEATTSQPEKEPATKESPSTENVPSPSKAPDNASVVENAKDSEIICIDDDEKEPSVQGTPEENAPEEALPTAEPKSQPEPVAESQAEKDPDSQAGKEPESQAEKETDSQADKEPETQTEKEPGSEPTKEQTAPEPESESNVTAPPLETENAINDGDVEMQEVVQKEDEEKISDSQAADPPAPPASDESQSVAMTDANNKQAGDETANEQADKQNKQQEPVVTNGNADQPKKSKKPCAPKCCNTACKKKNVQFCDAPEFALSLYKVPHSIQVQHLCYDCFEEAVSRYETLTGLLVNHQPLLLHDNQPDVAEILMVLDSSDEEDEDTVIERKNEPALPAEAVSLVESDLDDVIYKLYGSLCLDQIKWSNSILLHEAEQNQATSDRIEAQMKTLKSAFQDIQNNIYSVRTTKIDKPELIIEDDATSEQIAHERFRSMLSKTETLHREPVQVGSQYFGVRTTVLASWTECKVLEVKSDMYTVRFLTGDPKPTVITAKHLAYTTPPNVKLLLGTRVVARTSSPTQDGLNRTFYAGTVLESLSSYNKYRYLIVLDSGHPQYSPFTDVRVVCDQSKHVWDDVHPHSREFIRNYMLKSGSVRPMVQAHRGQRMMVEIDDKWFQGTVLETDSSLVRLYFSGMERKEWIYRGSSRLAPLYREVSTGHAPNNKFSKFQKRNEPSIEYITLEDDDSEQPPEKKAATVNHQPAPKMEIPDTPNRAKARKSTASRMLNNHNNNNVPVSLNRNTIYIDCDQNQSNGRTLNYTTKNYRGPRKFVPHNCGPSCPYKGAKNLRSYNLLARPLITGWERHKTAARGQKKSVVLYRAPCGRRLRNMAELHQYLRVTDSPLNVEHFDFDPDIRALATFKAENVFFECTDLSFGLEPMPVHCVNNYDNKQPPPCEYSTERIPTEGVNLNLDKEFLCGCDCEDDCMDKSKCQCWQLTLAGAKYGLKKNQDINTVGYHYKRLMSHLSTGIYECNVQCKCKKDKCLNRVVQNSLQTKLQVFNTHNKGWGIRCLNDVPKGSFICIYAGHLLTEETSNRIIDMSEDKSGDEYFADLDFIETVEKSKADYEAEAYQSDREDSTPAGNANDSDASEDAIENGTSPSTHDSDEEYTTKSKPSGTVVKTRAQLRKASTTERPNAAMFGKKSSNDGVNDEQECVNLIPNPEMDMDASGGPNDESLFRKLYGENEHIFVMDAKKSGNLGRYFNHSCDPNLFVQNVFVDTHDLRFPWVAFFAERNIKAGTELTWNYNYDVGSVKGKHLTCSCGEKNCKGRLL
ncbi:histone-lysine N-methyltransferase eggless [Anopheles arabiensis]|uniref:Histone-lysine N-methyltransferase n=1 Tax=Anopheles arabiensis TaxID=7173 RepID=A0A8W7M178_ANOAR|nr:histone-lysine N-methyltransferase eggless [Anopheles arabiensis]